MIDLNRQDSPPTQPSLGIPMPGVDSQSPQNATNVADLFDELFSDPEALAAAQGGQSGAVIPHDAAAADAPQAPLSLKQTGLSLGTICELILKQLYLQGNLLGIQFARQMRLPFTVVEEGLRFLKDDKCIEVAS